MRRAPCSLPPTCPSPHHHAGFDDVRTLRSDPDLRPLQGPALEALINKHTGVGGALARLLGQQKKDEAVLESDPNQSKPWILW